MKKCVVLLSGGLDSLVTAAVAVEQCAQTYFLHINYGQLTEAKELQSFRRMVDYYRPEDFLVTGLDFLKKIKGSSLLDSSISMPSGKDGHRQIPNTYVPFRNALMLAVAVSWAETLDAVHVYIGAVEEDSSGYPDCREVFFKAYNDMIRLGTKNENPISVVTPVIHYSKKEIILLGEKLQAPLQYSWSCYCNNERACGTCLSCRLRLKAFREAGINDPIPYETEITTQ